MNSTRDLVTSLSKEGEHLTAARRKCTCSLLRQSSRNRLSGIARAAMPHFYERLIVGIDFGTTFSGVAYAVVPKIIDTPLQIESIQNWHKKGTSIFDQASGKVPSIIAYETPGSYHCGYDIPPHLTPIKWVKLLLEPHPAKKGMLENQELRDSLESIKRAGKTPITVVADYLQWLWRHVIKTIQDDQGNLNLLSEVDTTIVFTVPAVWSDKAIDNTVVAVHKAGLSTKGRKVKFIKEPEAAALLSLRLKAQGRRIKEGDCVIVCDAGGGTVDVVTYELLGTDPISLGEVVIGDGAMCGSTFVDMAFRAQMEGQLQAKMQDLSEAIRDKITQTFEHVIKRNYIVSDSRRYFIEVPGMADDAARKIESGSIEVDNYSIQLAFEEVMTGIMTLLDGQKRKFLEYQSRGQDLKAILLIGGFNECQFLKERIDQEYGQDSDQTLTIWRSDHGWTAVCRGAVYCEHISAGALKPVQLRLARKNYGVPYNIRFNDAHHDIKDKYYCKYSRAFKARDQITWFVKKGDKIKEDEPPLVYDYILIIKKSDFDPSRDKKIFLAEIVTTDEDDPPERKTKKVKHLVDISCTMNLSILEEEGAEAVPTFDFPEQDFSSSRASSESSSDEQETNDVWRVPVTIEMSMGPALLEFRCKVNGRMLGDTKVSYID